MADFEIKVNDRAFHQLGVMPVIDENLYGELIDNNVTNPPKLRVATTPSVLWPGRSLSQRLHDIREGDALLPVGGYLGRERPIVLPAHPDAELTSILLIHETKHLIDDINGDSQESAATM